MVNSILTLMLCIATILAGSFYQGANAQQQFGNTTTLSMCNPANCIFQRSSCSSNLDCECFILSSNSFAGICAVADLSCSSLVRCNWDNVSCSIDSTVCVNSTRCGQPVCYPLALANVQVCPAIATNGTGRTSKSASFQTSTLRTATSTTIRTTTMITATTKWITSTTATKTTTKAATTLSTTKSTTTVRSTTTTPRVTTSTTLIQTTWFTGVQQNVSLSSMRGWQLCYNDTYNIILTACRPVDSPLLTLAAMGNRSDVLYDCGTSRSCTNVANGVGWYFSSNWSWGYANGTDTVCRNTCDYAGCGTQVNSDLRLCWHTSGISGFRCGAQELMSNNQWERLIYHVD